MLIRFSRNPPLLGPLACSSLSLGKCTFLLVAYISLSPLDTLGFPLFQVALLSRIQKSRPALALTFGHWETYTFHLSLVVGEYFSNTELFKFNFCQASSGQSHSVFRFITCQSTWPLKLHETHIRYANDFLKVSLTGRGIRRKYFPTPARQEEGSGGEIHSRAVSKESCLLISSFLNG